MCHDLYFYDALIYFQFDYIRVSRVVGDRPEEGYISGKIEVRWLIRTVKGLEQPNPNIEAKMGLPWWSSG